jgi:phosphate-selective porin OprO/OprP
MQNKLISTAKKLLTAAALAGSWLGTQNVEAQMSDYQLVPVVSPVSYFQDGQFQSPSDRPVEPLPEIIQTPPKPIVVANTEDLPKAPDESAQFEKLIQRLTTTPGEAEVKPAPQVDLSGDKIREQVKGMYDKEYAAGLPPDGWSDVSEEAWTHKFGGRILMDYVSWLDDSEIGGAPDYFEFRQIRLNVSGVGYGNYEYRLQVDFEPEVADTDGGVVVSRFGTVSLEDAFVGLRDVPLFGNVRVGHQKVHFSLSQMMNRSDLLFAERVPMSESSPMSDAPGFTPGREVGISSLTSSPNQNRTLGYGIYFDDINQTEKQRADDNMGLLLGGRSTFLPYYDEPSNGRYLVHFGSGFIWRKPHGGTVRFRGRPSLNEAPILLDSGTIFANEYRVTGLEFAAQAGPMMLQSEFMYATIDEFGPGQRQLYSYYVEGAYRLTGEHRNYNRSTGIFESLIPYENFWMLPGSRGWGAWELAARYSYTDFADSPTNSSLENIDLGVNWYWNSSISMQMNYIHPMTEGGAFGSTESDALLLRMGVYF